MGHVEITCTLLLTAMQEVFFIPYACSLCGPFVALHTWRQYLTLSHTVKEIILHGILELRLMPQLLEDKPQVIFQYDRVPLTYTVRWHSWAGSCLDDGLIEAGSTVWSLWSLLDFLLWWFCEIRNVCVATAFKHYQLKGLSMNSSCKNWTDFFANCWDEVEFYLNVCRATEHMFHWNRGFKNLVSCSLQWYVFKF